MIDFTLDALLTTSQAALWLQMTERELLAKCKGRKAKIPAMWLNRRVVRFHPRTIVAKLAADAGVSPEVIASSLQTSAENPNPHQGSQ